MTETGSPLGGGTTQPSDTRLFLLPITLLALTLRGGIVAVSVHHDPASWFFSQATELAALANSLIRGHELSSPFGGTTGPSAFLAPGYPWIVAAVFHIFGSYTTSSAVALMIFQALFGVATVIVVVKTTQKLFSNREANVAGAICALSPPLIWIPIVFWETSLSILLLSTLLLLSIRCAARCNIRWWGIFGVVAGLSLLVNPALALIVAVLLIWASHRIYKANLHWMKALLVAATLATFIFIGWPIRNYRIMHKLILFRTNMGYELWQGNRPGSNGFFLQSLHPNVNRIEFQRYSSLGEIGYMREKSTLARLAIEANPRRFTYLSSKRFFCFWTGRTADGKSEITTVYITSTTTLGMISLFILYRCRNRAAAVLCLPLLIFPIPYYLTHPDPRFRLVIDPTMIILTAYLIVILNDRLKKNSVR